MKGSKLSVPVPVLVMVLPALLVPHQLFVAVTVAPAADKTRAGIGCVSGDRCLGNRSCAWRGGVEPDSAAAAGSACAGRIAADHGSLVDGQTGIVPDSAAVARRLVSGDLAA